MPTPDPTSDDIGGAIDWMGQVRGTRTMSEFIGMSDGPGARALYLSALPTDFPAYQLRKLPLERTRQSKVMEFRECLDI